MDDIARELGVSKRTIYEQFQDKDQLLKTCLKFVHRHMSDKILEYLRNNSHNTLEVILTMYEVYFTIMRTVNKQFFIDLQKMPEITEKNHTREERNRRMFILLMRKGINEGLFREDTNFDVLVYLLQHGLQLITFGDKFKSKSSDEIGQAFILFYLRGIATTKGQEIIEEFIQKRNKENNEQKI